MKLRALPQSFWQQPNSVNTMSPGNMYLPVLPPLCKSEHSNVDPSGRWNPSPDARTFDRNWSTLLPSLTQATYIWLIFFIVNILGNICWQVCHSNCLPVSQFLEIESPNWCQRLQQVPWVARLPGDINLVVKWFAANPLGCKIRLC